MIKNLFTQDVNREIETVVKADDARHIDTEIKEYVITKEISQKIGTLFSEYGRSSTINGVWIHGFFGSGKSHLLKMLSYVFSDRKLNDGSTATEIFASKASDEILKGDILNAANIPAESILFNIDQQATLSSKEKGESVLSVFYKVFYDHLGFYGTQPHIAEFEWWLKFRKEIYTEFVEKFREISGKEWTEARRDYYDLDITDAISKTLGHLLGRGEDDYEMILEDLEEKQNLSVEDFAKRVADYIRTKPQNFQLNFFIDEVGQFIAGDVNLMLNLQTITESLSSVTNNKSWVFATAQSAIEGLGEDLKKTQDYSKILGRFRMQINLTSANVDEVIEKRLLEKRDKTLEILKETYSKNQSLINTLISSSGKGLPITAYQDEDDFIRKYPFLYYQFSLFQECRISLANHDVFQGEHASVGERSMLGVFQEVLKSMTNEEIQTLVSFDKMYNGIENDLRAEFLNNINNAERNLGDPFAMKVLKTLFLVKYYKQFLATSENIAMLLIDHIHINLTEHQEKVNKALASLENHTYIERNGDLYEFLTNKERDIENEIRNTKIEESEVNRVLKELFYDEVLGRHSQRIRFEENKQDYSFTQKLDEGTFGREKELTVEIITPNYDGINNLDHLKSQTMGLPILRLVTEADSKFVEDVRMYLKVQRYNALQQSESNNDDIRSILYQKLSDNTKRKDSLIHRADTLLGKARAFVSGAELEVLPKSSGQTYVIECFQDLIRRTYPHLRMLGKTTYTEDSLKYILKGIHVPGLFDSGDTTVSEAETQILNYIQRRKNQRDRTSIYDLKNHFNKKPYGWHDNATFCIVAKLYKKNKIEVTIGENPLNDEQVLDALLNSSQHTRAFIHSQTIYSSAQIKRTKELFRDLFDQNTTYNDARDIGMDFKEKLNTLYQDVTTLLAQKTDFPFVRRLQSFADHLQSWRNKSYKDILDNAEEIENQLLDTKEDDYDPIRVFIKGKQANIYKNIVTAVHSETANWDYVEGDEIEHLRTFLEEEKPYLGNALQRAESHRKSLKEKVLKLIEKEKQETRERFQQELEQLRVHSEMIKLDPKDWDRITQPIVRRMDKIDSQRFIGNLKSDQMALHTMVEQALNQAVRLNTPVEVVEAKGEVEGNEPGIVREPIVKYVNKIQVKVPFEKNELSTEDDVRQYVKALEKTYLQKIKERKRIRL